MPKFPQFVRELRPHAIWYGVDRFIIAALIGTGGGRMLHVSLLDLTLLSFGLVLLVRPLFEHTSRQSEAKTRLERLALMQIWYHCDRLLSAYRRLDYDHRDNCRLPFAQSSWPSFGSPWECTHAQLYSLNQQMTNLKGDLHILRLYEWKDWSEAQIPATDEHSVMVDFLAQMGEFTAYLKNKIPESQAARES